MLQQTLGGRGPARSYVHIFWCLTVLKCVSAVAMGVLQTPRLDLALCSGLAGQKRGLNYEEMLALKFLVIMSAGDCSKWAKNISRWGFFSQNVWIFYNAEEIFTCAHWSHPNMYHFLISNAILPRYSQLRAEGQKATLEMPGIEASLLLHSLWTLLQKENILQQICNHIQAHTTNQLRICDFLFQVCGLIFMGQSRF